MRMKIHAMLGAAIFYIVSSIALAADTPPTLPDGPVASPPGYSCYALHGKVYCVKIDAGGH